MSRPPYVVEYRTVTELTGPLLFLEGVRDVGVGEQVEVLGPSGAPRSGQVLELSEDRALVEVHTGTRGLDRARTRVRPHGHPARLAVGRALLARVLDGGGRPADGGPPLLPEALREVHGAPMNPSAREHPADFIETGISAIDGLNTLVRGQKLPVFSLSGVPVERLVAQIVAAARVPSAPADGFVVVLAAMGITSREAAFYREFLDASGALPRTVVFQNRADDPAIERLLTPRLALTAAEYFAFELGMHVLVVMTDVSSYCEALREIATARQEVPGRRGFPGYMYTDLAGLFERAGRIRGAPGSLTQLVVLTMPDDDITHPIPDLTGYITEGQIVLSRDLERRGVWPPVDVLPSLSRLMNAGIGAGKTRADHRPLADQVYACYARGRELRRFVSIVGEEALLPPERRYLAFADRFERELLDQRDRARTLEATLDLMWTLLEPFSDAELKRIPQALLEERRKRAIGRAEDETARPR